MPGTIPTPGFSVPHGDFLDQVQSPEEWGPNLGYDAEFTLDGLPAGWGWVNQGTATFTRTLGHGVIEEPSAASGNQLRIIDRAIPSEATFDVYAKMNGRHYPHATTFGWFLSLRDSASGKIVIFGFNGATSAVGNLGLQNWASTSALSAAVTSVNTDYAPAVKYWRIRKNLATSWDFMISTDAVVWESFQSAHNVQTFLGTAPTHIGFGLVRNNTTTSMAVDWFRVR